MFGSTSIVGASFLTLIGCILLFERRILVLGMILLARSCFIATLSKLWSVKLSVESLYFLFVGFAIVWFSLMSSSSVNLQSGESNIVLRISWPSPSSYLYGLIVTLKSFVTSSPSLFRFSIMRLSVFLSISKDFYFSSSVFIRCLTINSETWPWTDSFTRLRQKMYLFIVSTVRWRELCALPVLF